ncbi:hypothetical protein B0H17DRAFT_1127118 [Mycena rosella]|uniref:Uncharacterized protein n=1 Tax=Mycena rosella TaxID=1033263 RepID=A0AAD7GSB8_MYCRO|nr:hypothetical protein B0H17DRAFT_1127118 [Mycena rosella]
MSMLGMLWKTAGRGIVASGTYRFSERAAAVPVWEGTVPACITVELRSSKAPVFYETRSLQSVRDLREHPPAPNSLGASRLPRSAGGMSMLGVLWKTAGRGIVASRTYRFSERAAVVPVWEGMEEASSNMLGRGGMSCKATVSGFAKYVRQEGGNTWDVDSPRPSSLGLGVAKYIRQEGGHEWNIHLPCLRYKNWPWGMQTRETRLDVNSSLLVRPWGWARALSLALGSPAQWSSGQPGHWGGARRAVFREEERRGLGTVRLIDLLRISTASPSNR